MSMPEIPPLTQDQLNRLLTADWLEQVAKMIRSGAANGFDIAWDTRYQKPVGTVQMSTERLQAPLELKMLAQIAEEQSKIRVEDVSEKIKDHACDSEECIVCNNTKNTQKS